MELIEWYKYLHLDEMSVSKVMFLLAGPPGENYGFKLL